MKSISKNKKLIKEYVKDTTQHIQGIRRDATTLGESSRNPENKAFAELP